MTMPHRFLTEEEFVKVMILAISSFASMFTDIDIILKCLIGLVTFIYICLKISKELHDRKERKNGQSNAGK